MTTLIRSGPEAKLSTGRTALRDTLVTDQVAHVLDRHPHLALRRVSCEFRDGCLILHGCVSSYFLKQLAQTAVAQVDGVERVENRIEVIPPPPNS